MPPVPVSPRLLAGGRVVTPGGVLSPGWIRLAGGLIGTVGAGEPPEPHPAGLPVTDHGLSTEEDPAFARPP